MGAFTILIKREPNRKSVSPAYDALPPAVILELTKDRLVFVWPIKKHLLVETKLNPRDPGDLDLMYLGQFITYSGEFDSLADYMHINELPHELFYILQFGEYEDVYAFREALSKIKFYL